MNRPHPIFLGLSNTRLPAEAAAEAARAGVHWRAWHRSGLALSAVAHGLLAVLLVAGWPEIGAQAEKEKPPIEIEIVRPPPDKAEAPKPEPERAEKKPEPPQAIPKPPKPDAERPKTPPLPQAKAAPSQPARPPQSAAAPPAATNPGARPEARWPVPQAPPQLAELPLHLGPAPRPAPEPGAMTQGPIGGLRVEPEIVALPDERKKGVDYWVLDPLTVDLRHECGLARVSAVIEITERLGEGRFRGTLRNTTRWTKCPPTETLHQVELRFAGNAATLVGAGGFIDRGVMQNGVMLLEDAYGRSVWRKR